VRGLGIFSLAHLMCIFVRRNIMEYDQELLEDIKEDILKVNVDDISKVPIRSSNRY
jgi:hypothetical protein